MNTEAVSIPVGTTIASSDASGAAMAERRRTADRIFRGALMFNT
ncbi:MAG: hypothetical protein V7647_1466, partial [Acidobacteriota bacterium]